MSKYKEGDEFILKIVKVERLFGRNQYYVEGFNGAFSENVFDKLEKKVKKEGGK